MKKLTAFSKKDFLNLLRSPRAKNLEEMQAKRNEPVIDVESFNLYERMKQCQNNSIILQAFYQKNLFENLKITFNFFSISSVF